MKDLSRSPQDRSESTPWWFSRLSQTATFRENGLDRWRRARIALVGAGVLGSPLATGVVQSGASIGVFDFDVGSVENQGTQPVEVGVKKVDTLVHRCDEIARGRAVGFDFDVRRAGVGLLDQFDLVIDCSDDPNLAMPLTEISNGLGKPLLRCALDGSGAVEMGRVLCSSAATGHACQICSYGLEDLRGTRPRTGCPDQAPSTPGPTVAGGAMAMVTAGVGLLSAQRIITGNDDHLVLGRETIVDLSNLHIVSIELPRSEKCLSGHLRWELNRLGARATETTFNELFAAAADHLAATAVTLEPYLSALTTQATCDCGELVEAVGTSWVAAPECARCRQPMRWRSETQLARISKAAAAELGILETPLADLGIPQQGPMFVARAEGKPPVRLVLDSMCVDLSPQEESLS